MTVTAVVPKNSYTAAGGTAFPYTFKILDAVEIIVYVNGIQVTTGFTVDGVGSVTGGNVTFVVAPTIGAKILLFRRTVRSQATDWSANDPDPAESKENAFDKLTNIVQEYDEVLSRALKVSILNSPIVDLPTPVVGQSLRWASLTQMEGFTPGNIAVPISTVTGFTKAGLPAPGTPGLLARVTDVTRSVWMDLGSQWLSLNGEIANAKEFGAIGNGIADDTVAIQAALTALQTLGGAFYFPPGTYLVNAARLTYSSLKPIMLLGAGWQSKLTWVAATDAPAQNKGMINISGTGDANALHCTHVTIRDLMFDFGSNRAAGYDTNKRGINIYNSDDINITNCYFKGSRGEMVGLGNFGTAATAGSRARVENNTFFDFAQDGLNPNVFDATIIGNKFLQGVSPIEAGRDGLTIIGNVCEDMTSILAIASVANFAVVGNRFKNCATTDPAARIGVIEVVGEGATAPSVDGTIANNAINNAATFVNQTGIFLTRGTSTSDNARIVIVGNTINGITHGIWVQSLLDGIINDNVLIGIAANAGILIASGGQALRNHVTGNKIRNYAARTVDPTTNGPIQDQTGEAGLNIVGWNSQENASVLGTTGRVDFTNLDTTPSVRRPAGIYYVANSGATVITQFDDATIGQCITLVFDEANTTINDSGNFLLNGNFVSTAGDCLELVWTGLSWVERGRSVN